MPHLIFDIDELLRLVIDEVVATSPQTAVAFAVTCRSFEEPTLSSLWRERRSLTDLTKVLSNHTRVRGGNGTYVIAVEDNPSTKDWARLRRYASWMRKLHLGYRKEVTTDTLHRLSCNSPDGLLCPMLEGLSWNVGFADNTLLFFRLFLSPHLKYISFNNALDIPWGQRVALAQVISFLPTSLEHLSVMCCAEKEGPLKDVISALVCRCGSSLGSFETCVPLSEAAIQHIMQLPHLHTWHTVQGPPRSVPTSIFPSLEDLHLGDRAAIPWLHLLASRGNWDGSASATSHSNIRETLKTLDCPRGTIVNSIFLSSVVNFSNLVLLRVHTLCHDEDGCPFRMTDDNVNDLTSALPRLKTLGLGNPCGLNSCETTVASLLSISVHCLDLTVLYIHFNTLTIVEDTQRLLDEGSGRDRAKCKLEDLWVGSMPLEIRSEDVETVATGLKAIFPSLIRAGYDGRWCELRAIFFSLEGRRGRI